MALGFVQFAYDVVRDEWDLPDIGYLKSLDGSNSSKQVLEEVAKEATKKLLAHLATVASQKLLNELLRKMEGLVIPDCTGKTQAMMAEVDYEAFNSRIRRVQPPLSQVFIEDGTIGWRVDNISVESVGDWKYRLGGGLLSDRGTYELIMAGMSFGLSASIQRHGSGYDLSFGDCNFNFGPPDLNLGGSPGCIALQCFFENLVKPELDRVLPNNLVECIKQLALIVMPMLEQYKAYWPMASGVIGVTKELVNCLV